MDNETSLKLNMLLNFIRGSITVAFPLITIPYISRVLGVANVGRYNFAMSIVNYFILLADLGIYTYAIREGASLRNSKKEIEIFARQIFTINLLSMFVSCILLLFSILMVKQFENYVLLILILSFQIVLKPFSVEWLYSIYEDYRYITYRSVFFQILSLLLLFVFVRQANDVYKYAVIVVISAAGSNIFNFIHSRKYVSFSITNNLDLKKHIKPITILFAMTIAVTIYVNSDITILGFLCDDYIVGIYSFSVKIYTGVKTILFAILSVSIPRLSAFYGEEKYEEFNKIGNEIYNLLFSIVAPAIIGIMIMKNQIIYIMGGEKYLDASYSLLLLSVALLFCLLSWFWGQCVLIPMRLEKIVFVSTICSAIVNVALNFLLIPLWEEKAAAITTIVAEFVSFMWCMARAKNNCNIRLKRATLIKVILGCLVVVIYGCFINKYVYCRNLNIVLMCGGTIVLYVLSQILLKNEEIISIFQLIKNEKIVLNRN